MAHPQIPTRKTFKQFSSEGTEDLDLWRQLFCDALDPTEYEGSLALGMTWAHWKLFKAAWPDFNDRILLEWLDEIEIRLRSEAVKRVVTQSKSNALDATLFFRHL